MDNRRLIYSCDEMDDLENVFPIDIVNIDCTHGFTEINKLVESYRKLYNYEHIWADILGDVPLTAINLGYAYHQGWVPF